MTCLSFSSVAPEYLVSPPIHGQYRLSLFFPGLAVAWRRLHDMGKGGQWYWISLIPIIGGIWLLVLLCTPSEPQDNRFGPAVDE